MNIVLTYNIRNEKPSLKDKRAMDEAEFDEPSTINGISRALKSLGHHVFLVEAKKSAFSKLEKIKTKTDLVFNVAEGQGKDREAHIPAILEILEMPYVGSRPMTQAICLDKTKTKEILTFHKIPTPKFQLFKNGDEKINRHLKFPIIIKPNSEGSSKGIFQSSFIKEKSDLKNKIRELLKKFNQPVLAEEFLDGREFTIGLIGNNPTEVLPPVEIDFAFLPKNFIPIDSYETKWIIDNPKSDIKTVICPANIKKNLWEKIREICIKTKEVLDILDWCRIDMRLDKNRVPNILDINQIPGIIPDPKENSRFPMAARAAGYNYEEMLNKIIKSACKRYDIKIC